MNIGAVREAVLADLDAIERSSRFFQVFGPQITTCLFCASLPSAYAAKNGVQTLALTARLQTDTRRRIMETGQFLMDVLEPGGLGEHARGRRTIQRVRLMHGAVRHLITSYAANDPTMWDPAWGVPIRAAFAAATAWSRVVTAWPRHKGLPQAASGTHRSPMAHPRSRHAIARSLHAP